MNPSEPNKFLITGGAGFIGSHLADKLLNMGNDVIVYDNLDEYYSDKEKNIEHNLSRKNFHFINGDILDYETLIKSMKGINIVFHLAAQPGVRFSMTNPDKTLKVNVLGTLNVLRASKETGVRRLVFASSSSVYGQIKYMPVDEKHPTKPTSIYGISKLTSENLCQLFNDQLGLKVVVLRYHTVYGPRQRPDMAIHKWVKQIFHNERITIYGDGNQTRDFTYIDDVVDATIKAAYVENIDGEIFNIGGGSNKSVNQVVRLLTKLTGMNVEIIYEPEQVGDVSHTYADVSKAKKILGYEPKTKLEEGLKKFIDWYKTYMVEA
jgi:UDP-glucose 4-epimerase